MCVCVCVGGGGGGREAHQEPLNEGCLAFRSDEYEDCVREQSFDRRGALFGGTEGRRCVREKLLGMLRRCQSPNKDAPPRALFGAQRRGCCVRSRLDVQPQNHVRAPRECLPHLRLWDALNRQSESAAPSEAARLER